MHETVVRADAALTPEGILAPAEIAFTTNKISYVGKPRPETTPHHNLAGHALMPGLVNTHTHSGMAIMRGVCDDKGFLPWLHALQNLEQSLTEDELRAGVELALVEMIETGTVAFADMYHWTEELVETVRASGMRINAALACFAPDQIGFKTLSPWNGREVLRQTEKLYTRYETDEQVHISFGPHAPYTCPPEFLQLIAAKARRLGAMIHIHLSESRAEVNDIVKRYGSRPAEHLRQIGFFNARVHAAHCVQLSGQEIETLNKNGVSISHNPVSNMKLGNGIAPVWTMLDAGINVTLGTDSAASNNSLDLFEEIKLTPLLQRGSRSDAGALSATKTLELATSAGAKAIGFDRGGTLKPGALADLIAVDTRVSNATPFTPTRLCSHLGFSAHGNDVRHVFIGGRHVYSEGKHLTVDAPAIRERAAQAREQLEWRAAKNRKND